MLRSIRSVRLAGGTLAIAFALAACSGSTSSSAPFTAAPGTVAVETKEFSFTPSTLTVPAGSVTFAVRNSGQEEHEFEIFTGEAVVDEVEGLVPGLTKNLTVTLEAGAYTFACKLNGHDQLGMKGTLTVN